MHEMRPAIYGSQSPPPAIPEFELERSSLSNSDIEADVALSRCAPSGPRSLMPAVRHAVNSRCHGHAELGRARDGIDGGSAADLWDCRPLEADTNGPAVRGIEILRRPSGPRSLLQAVVYPHHDRLTYERRALLQIPTSGRDVHQRASL